MKMHKRQKTSDAHGWMVYGVTGRLGEFIIQKALAQGLTPVMGGRSIARLRAMADKYQLPWRLVDLDQPEQAAKALKGIDFIYSAAAESTVSGLVGLCQSTATHLLIPHQLTADLTKQHNDAVALAGHGAAVISGAGFHTAATESLLAIAQQQPHAAEFSAFHVALLGLPFLHPGYTREFLPRITAAKPAAKSASKAVIKRSGRHRAWYDAMLKEMAQHPTQAWRGLGGKGLNGMRWWPIDAPERAVASLRCEHTPVSVYLPVAPWLQPLLKHFSGLAVGLLEPVLGRAAQLASIGASRQTGKGKEKDVTGVLNGLFKGASSVAAQLITRQGQGVSRSAAWLVAEHSDGQFSRFGIEFPEVYDMVSTLAVVMARDLLSNPVSSRKQIAVAPVLGVQTAIECFGADVLLAVPDTLRFGALKKSAERASAKTSETVAPIASEVL